MTNSFFEILYFLTITIIAIIITTTTIIMIIIIIITIITIIIKGLIPTLAVGNARLP